MSAGSFFLPHDDGYLPTEAARSPWSEELLHGGPVGALIAHVVERLIDDPAYRLARLTTDLFRPVPCAPLRVETEVARDGRLVKGVRASIYAGDVEVTRAQAALLATSDSSDPEPDDIASPLSFPSDPQAQPPSTLHQGFATTVEWREPPPSSPPASEDFVRWIRVPLPLLPGVPLSPAVRAAAVADFVSPLSHMRPPVSGSPFINADVTLYLHRPPKGEWLALVVNGRDHSDGIAVSHALLHDRTGAVGRCLAASLPLPQQAPRSATPG